MIKSKTALIMGLGLNPQGSGVAAALYLARQGYRLVITDLRSKEVLQPTIKLLAGVDATWVLGEHRHSDFADADLVVKNPGVKRSSPFLAMVKDSQIETDCSLFLQQNHNPLIAVTGSKGKSSTVTALQQIYTMMGVKSFLGGNITVSPLSFINEIAPNDKLVLELSSWQLGDLAGRGLLRPNIALITNLLNDHQNYYNNDMMAYASDKKVILESQQPNDWLVLNADNSFTAFFEQEARARKAYFSTKPLDDGYATALFLNSKQQLVYRRDGLEEVFEQPSSTLANENLLATLLVLLLDGYMLSSLLPLVAKVLPPEHRLEKVAEKQGRLFYNDSAATMPLATVLALQRFPTAHFVIGGADKELDFTVLAPYLKQVKSVMLLDGTAVDKLRAMLDANQINYRGPFDNFIQALNMAFSQSEVGDIVVLSPSCASFGMFLNEFDRGTQFKQWVAALPS